LIVSDICNEVLDRGGQVGDVVVVAAAGLLLGEDRKPEFDHVQPQGAGWGEVEMLARVVRQPGLDLGRGVG
jgi:hypothetical protein